jgi:hypothetical protein
MYCSDENGVTFDIHGPRVDQPERTLVDAGPPTRPSRYRAADFRVEGGCSEPGAADFRVEGGCSEPGAADFRVEGGCSEPGAADFRVEGGCSEPGAADQ